MIFSEIIWYKDDKPIFSDERFVIENEDQRTTCKIKKAKKDLEGVYVCKAISDIGMAITKAKLHVYGQDAQKPKKSKKQEEVEEETVVTEKTKSVKKAGKKKTEVSSVKQLKHEVTSEPAADEVVTPFEDTTETHKAILRKVEGDARVAAEIDELLEVINAREFGPGEKPLRELATIGYVL